MSIHFSEHRFKTKKTATSTGLTEYILCSNVKTLQALDAEAGKVIVEKGGLFKRNEVVRKCGNMKRYQALLKQNSLLFTLDLVKEKLLNAYELTDECQMKEQIDQIIDLCRATGNKHFEWFARLLESHMTGIIAHATFRISSGKIEGVNNKIKTLRRQGYGYPDDDYFFLKIIDASRKPYVRNPKSHMVFH